MKKYILTLFIGIGLFFASEVKADTFGYTSVGTSNEIVNSSIKLNKITSPSSNGTLDNIRAYIYENSSNNCKLAVYLSTGYNYIDNTTEFTSVTAGWNTNDVVVGESVISTNSYYMVIWGQGVRVKYDAATFTQRYKSLTYVTGNGDFPTTITGTSTYHRRDSIYATYTAGGSSRRIITVD